MSHKHTPGPWVVEKSRNSFFDSIGGAYLIMGPDMGNGHHVARLTDESGDREANANLIVKSPEMRLILDKLVELSTRTDSMASEDFGSMLDDARRLLAEIDK